MKYQNTFRVKNSAKELASAIASMNLVELVTPENLVAEKAAWMRRIKHEDISNPHFFYNEAKLLACSRRADRINNLYNLIIESVEPETKVDHAILAILERRIASARETCHIAKAIYEHDNATTARCIANKYGYPTPKELEMAYSMACDNKRPLSKSEPALTTDERFRLSHRTLNALDLMSLFDFALNFYCFDGDWTTDIRHGITTVDVRYASLDSRNNKRIDLPENGNYSALDALRLVSHEVEYHIRTIENSRELFFSLLGDNSPLLPLVDILAKSDDETFYEGAAKNSDVRICGPDAAPDPCLIIGIDQARRGASFAEVVDTISCFRLGDNKFTNKELMEARQYAWNIAYRIFRGFSRSGYGYENKQGYAFTKDYAYLSGFNLVQEVDPILRDFASLTMKDITDLQNAGVELIPTHEYGNLSRYIYGKSENGDILSLLR